MAGARGSRYHRFRSEEVWRSGCTRGGLPINVQDAVSMWKKRKRFWKDEYRRRLAASCEHGENVDVFALRFIRHGAAPSNNYELRQYHEPHAWEMMFLELVIWFLRPTSRFADFAALQHALTLLTLLAMQWNTIRNIVATRYTLMNLEHRNFQTTSTNSSSQIYLQRKPCRNTLLLKDVLMFYQISTCAKSITMVSSLVQLSMHTRP